MSSSDVAVSVRGLSKAYTIAHNAAKHTTAGEALMHRLKHPLEKAEKETFWALKDVDFDIKKGDVVGIIGRNGAGKSTLLKILSRITTPTTGRIALYGRVGSLLEVGTGFHPELTGRENIYLNGAILGMSKREITREFDAIVDFSGTEQFLDTPVKRYSSGMYIRLAFAVAAHLNPEILIVDEVLAVGDTEFQKKCLGKMKEVACGGRTVLFVSHNMQAVAMLCNKGIMLENGKLSFHGTANDVVDYYSNSYSNSKKSFSDSKKRPGSGEYRFTEVRTNKNVYRGDQRKEIFFRAERTLPGNHQVYLSALLINELGYTISQFDSRLVGFWSSDDEVIEGVLAFDSPWLKSGEYRLDLYICSASAVPIMDKYEDACRLLISPVMPYSHSASDDAVMLGTVLADFDWEVKNL